MIAIGAKPQANAHHLTTQLDNGMENIGKYMNLYLSLQENVLAHTHTCIHMHRPTKKCQTISEQQVSYAYI